MIPKSVLGQWNLSGPQEKIGKGLINDTYRVGDRFVLQRINDKVFRAPLHLMANYEAIYPYVRDLVPNVVRTESGALYTEDARGQIWRCMDYYPSRNFQSLPDNLVYTAGRAFGHLLRRLRTCDISLEPAIPNFHDFGHYFAEFEQVCSKHHADVIEFDLMERCRELTSFATPRSRKQVIHGDCKVSNLLFDGSKSVVTRIVDIDTFMFGNPEWDFGDLVRSIATGCDSEDQLKLRLNSVCRGFFQQYPIAREDVPHFVCAPAYMSLMLGIRFLTDDIRGDQYFKVKYQGENRNRAREQFDVARRFDRLEGELSHTIITILEDSPTCL